MLAERPININFIADGPQRPAIKRGKHTKTAAQWLTEGMCFFIEGFRFTCLRVCLYGRNICLVD